MPAHRTSSESDTGLLLSGGLDSGILLGLLLAQGRRVQPFYVRAGLNWETAELRAASRLCESLKHPNLASLFVLEMPLGDVYAGHWSLTGQGIPACDSTDDAVYLPVRNALLLIKAALICQLRGIGRLAIAPLGTSPFADAKLPYLQRFVAALLEGTAGTVEVEAPLATLTKREVMRLGRDFPLELTFSCLAPQHDLHCGNCNKCAERQTAFHDAGLVDRTRYADVTSAPALRGQS